MCRSLIAFFFAPESRIGSATSQCLTRLRDDPHATTKLSYPQNHHQHEQWDRYKYSGSSPRFGRCTPGLRFPEIELVLLIRPRLGAVSTKIFFKTHHDERLVQARSAYPACHYLYMSVGICTVRLRPGPGPGPGPVPIVVKQTTDQVRAVLVGIRVSLAA